MGAPIPIGKFSKGELSLLESTFKDLSGRSGLKGGKLISKDVLLKFFFKVPGPLGERLFAVLDSDGDGAINFTEFTDGMKQISSVHDQDRISTLFKIFDLTSTGNLTKVEMETILLNVVDLVKDSTSEDAVRLVAGVDHKALVVDAFPDAAATPLNLVQFTQWLARHPDVPEMFQCLLENANMHSLMKRTTLDDQPGTTPPTMVADARNVKMTEIALADVQRMRRATTLAGVAPPLDDVSVSSHTERGSTIRRSNSKEFTKVSDDFKVFDVKFTGSIEPTSPIALSTPMFDAAVGCALSCNCGMTIRCCYRCGRQFERTVTGALKCVACGELFTGKMQFCMSCGEAIQLNEPELGKTSNADRKEGWLTKLGQRLKQVSKRYYVVRGQFLYSYNKPTDVKSLHAQFLEGCYVEAVNHEHINSKLKFGIEIIISDSPKKVSRVLYADTLMERNSWMTAIQAHANIHNIEDYYTLGKELGVGAFSSVREADSKATGQKYAAKIIEKQDLDMKEREALTSEIAVLKLLSHPHIIKLKNVFETRRQICIVMTYIEGGDLFDRLLKKKRFSESVCRSLISKLLSALEYLHTRGIVHRDLKPENIMCRSDDDDDIVIGDFGLSKFAGVSEDMNASCGTLAYMAPEVIQKKHYGKAVDMWSVGVIMYLILCGRLPFGNDEQEITQRSISGTVPFTSCSVWKGISEQAKDLVCRLLEKDAGKRIDVSEARQHDWFDLDFEENKRVTTKEGYESDEDGQEDLKISQRMREEQRRVAAERRKSSKITNQDARLASKQEPQQNSDDGRKSEDKPPNTANAAISSPAPPEKSPEKSPQKAQKLPELLETVQGDDWDMGSMTADWSAPTPVHARRHSDAEDEDSF